jgi:hypothetical protein
MPVTYGTKPFQSQVDFFRRKLNVGTRGWTDIWQGQHDRAFMVAGAMKADLLEDLRRAVDKSISQGTTLAAFRKDFDAIVQKHGWGYNGGRNWRTRVIYETNLRTSYQAGRYQQMKAVAHSRPYWQYRHSDYVKKPRREHLRWDGLILRHDDPWWDTHYPPNGWGCRCSVRTLAERDMKKLGKSGPDQAPPLNWQEHLVGKRSGHPQQVRAPQGIDPGWAYAPGKSALKNMRYLVDKTRGLPPRLGMQFAQEMASVIEKQWKEWIDNVLADPLPRRRYALIGAMDAAEIAYLENAGQSVTRTDVSIGDRLIVGKKADRHSDDGSALSENEWRTLPERFAMAEAVLYDNDKQNLLYVLRSEDSRSIKLAVDPEFTAKRRPIENSVRAAFKIDRSALMDRRRYSIIRGQIK